MSMGLIDLTIISLHIDSITAHLSIKRRINQRKLKRTVIVIEYIIKLYSIDLQEDLNSPTRNKETNNNNQFKYRSYCKLFIPRSLPINVKPT